MTRLWTGSAVRTGHSQQGLLSPHFVRCAATDPSNTTTQHGFNQAIRKRVQLKQSHRKISNHPPHAVLDLGADTKTLKSYMDSLVEVQTSLDLVDCRNVLEATLARDAEPVSDVCHVPCQDRAANQASDRRSSGEPSTSGNHADEDTKRPNLMRANLKRRVPTQRSSVQAATHKSSVHPTSRGLRSPARLRRGKSVQGRLKAQNARFSPGVRAQVAEVPYELKGTSAAKDAIYMKGLIERLSREQSASLESGLKRRQSKPHSGVSMYLDMMRSTQLLDKDAEVRLTRIAQCGWQLEQRAAELAETLGHEPSDSHIAADLGLLNAAHAKLIMENANTAKSLMVQHNVRLVVSNAKYFRGRGVDMQDLVVEGVGGLLKAVERFDVERGFRFSTYAYWWIRQVLNTPAIASELHRLARKYVLEREDEVFSQAMHKLCVEEGMIVRLPSNVYDLAKRIQREEAQAICETGRSPTPEELASALQISPEQVRTTQQMMQLPRSLEEGVFTKHTPKGMEQQNYEDVLFDEDDGDPESLVVESEEQMLAKEQVNRCLACLEPRERNVMRMRHGLHSPEGRGMSLRDIAAAYGLTPERVRQIELMARRKVEQHLRMQLMRPEVAAVLGVAEARNTRLAAPSKYY